MRTPRVREQARAAATSSRSGSPAIRLSPCARAASMSARCAIDLSPGTRSSPETLLAGSTICADSTSVGGTRALLKEFAHAVAAVDALAVIVQDLNESIDRLDQWPAIGRRDVFVQGRVTLGQPNHAPKPRAAESWVGEGTHRLRVRNAEGEGEVAEIRHLPVVRLGGEDLRPRPNRAHEAEPFIERREFLPLIGGEHPGLPPKQRRIALAQPAALLAGHRVTAEESRGIGQAARPLENGALHARDVGDDGLSWNVGGGLVEPRAGLGRRGGDHGDVAIGEVAKFRRRVVDGAALLRRRYPIGVVRDTAHLDRPTKPA